MSPRQTRQLRLLVALGLAGGLGACSGYLDHNDTVSASAGDAVVFGSFNNPAKLSDELLRLWGRVLARLPSARITWRLVVA